MFIATVIPEPAVLAIVACPVLDRNTEALKTSGRLNIAETLIVPLAVGGLVIVSTNATLDDDWLLIQSALLCSGKKGDVAVIFTCETGSASSRTRSLATGKEPEYSSAATPSRVDRFDARGGCVRTRKRVPAAPGRSVRLTKTAKTASSMSTFAAGTVIPLSLSLPPSGPLLKIPRQSASEPSARSSTVWPNVPSGNAERIPLAGVVCRPGGGGGHGGELGGRWHCGGAGR